MLSHDEFPSNTYGYVAFRPDGSGIYSTLLQPMSEMRNVIEKFHGHPRVASPLLLATYDLAHVTEIELDMSEHARAAWEERRRVLG